MKLLVLVIALGLARVASATAPCENTPVRYDPPELFDEATQSFAVPGSQAWCDVDKMMSETRGAVSFVELRDAHDHVLGTLSTAQGADAAHLRATRGDFEAVAIGNLHTTLLRRGYKPIVTRSKGCKLSTAWTGTGSQDGWPAAALHLDVQSGTKRLLRVDLGVGSAARRGDQWIRAAVIAKELTIIVLAIVPSCAGPPPGYFGPDDGGECYPINTPVVVTLAPASYPTAIAACF